MCIRDRFGANPLNEVAGQLNCSGSSGGCGGNGKGRAHKGIGAGRIAGDGMRGADLADRMPNDDTAVAGQRACAGLNQRRQQRSNNQQKAIGRDVFGNVPKGFVHF